MDGTLAAGQAALQAGNIHAAIRSAKQVLQDDPQDTDALDLLHSAHMAERDYMSAQEVLNSWLRIDPNDPDAHSSQIILQMTLGRQDDAKARIAQFSASFPSAVYHSRWLEAIWEEAFGSPVKAAALYEEMLSLQPGATPLIIRLAMAHAESRDFIAAGELMLDVLREDANNADALRTLAVSELKAFQLGSARQFAEAARAANPSDMAMKKVIWLSWLVLFPPFAVGHILQMFIAHIRHMAGSVAANVACGVLMVGAVSSLVYASEAQEFGDTLPLQTSLILATVFLASLWALFMYYVFGIGNADDDKRTATLTGGY